MRSTSLLDDLITKMKDRLTKEPEARQSKFEGKQVKEGRTWKRIAEEFVHEIKPILDKYPKGFNMRGEDIRPFVANPNSAAFRKHCRVNGVKVIKCNGMDIYTFEKIDLVAQELKKREGSGLFRTR